MAKRLEEIVTVDFVTVAGVCVLTVHVSRYSFSCRRYQYGRHGTKLAGRHGVAVSAVYTTLARWGRGREVYRPAHLYTDFLLLLLAEPDTTHTHTTRSQQPYIHRHHSNTVIL